MEELKFITYQGRRINFGGGFLSRKLKKAILGDFYFAFINNEISKFDSVDLSPDSQDWVDELHTQFGTYGASIRALVIHDGFIYAGGSTTNAIRRWSINDPTGTPTTFSTYGGQIDALVIHDGFIYAGGATTNAIRRWSLTDPSVSKLSYLYTNEIIYSFTLIPN